MQLGILSFFILQIVGKIIWNISVPISPFQECDKVAQPGSREGNTVRSHYVIGFCSHALTLAPKPLLHHYQEQLKQKNCFTGEDAVK